MRNRKTTTQKMRDLRVNTVFVPAFILAILSICFATVVYADYQVINETSNNVGPPNELLEVTETQIQDGDHPLNTFTIHRVKKPNAEKRGTVLLLPSLGNSFAMYEVTENNNYQHSFAGILAKKGFVVYGYSTREKGINAGECGISIDCTPMLDWGLQTIVNDIEFIRTQIASDYPGLPPVIGGLSLGSIASLAVVNDNPAGYAGLIAWEGSIYSDDSAVQNHNLGFCTAFDNLLAGGVPADEQNLPFVKLVAALAKSNPSDPFLIPVPGFPPGLTNHQALVFILSVPNPIAPSPKDGFITVNGDFTAGEFFYADEARLIASLEVFNDILPHRYSRDLNCALAGDTTFTSNLDNFTGPAYVIKAGLGFGSIMDELPGVLVNATITMDSMENFAHVDQMMAPYHKSILEKPIIRWMKKEVY